MSALNAWLLRAIETLGYAILFCVALAALAAVVCGVVILVIDSFSRDK